MIIDYFIIWKRLIFDTLKIAIIYTLVGPVKIFNTFQY